MENNVRKGRCGNYGECDKAGQEFSIEEGKPFECPECHSRLTPIGGPKGSGKKKKGGISPLFIGGAVVAVAVVAAGLYFALRTPGDEIPTVIDKEYSEPADSVPVVEETVPNRNDTLVIITAGDVAATEEDAEDVAEEVAAEEAVAEEVVEETPAPAVASTPAAQPSAQATTSYKLSYGSWTGGWKNGQPHGTGTLTYSTRHTIDSRDSKGRVAQPGEYIVGEWDNGRLVQGRWFKKDGTKEAVIIGKAG